MLDDQCFTPPISILNSYFINLKSAAFSSILNSTFMPPIPPQSSLLLSCPNRVVQPSKATIPTIMSLVSFSSRVGAYIASVSLIGLSAEVGLGAINPIPNAPTNIIFATISLPLLLFGVEGENSFIYFPKVNT